MSGNLSLVDDVDEPLEVLLGASPDDELNTATEEHNVLVEWEDATPTDHAELAAAPHPRCPPPTRFKVMSAKTVRGRRLHAVSRVYGPSQVPMHVKLCTDRTLTFGAELSGSGGFDIKFIEAQVGVKLSASVSVSRSECISFDLPRGRSVYLAAQAIYVQRRICRTVWGSAMCNRVDQCVVVNTPINKALLVANAPA